MHTAIYCRASSLRTSSINPVALSLLNRLAVSNRQATHFCGFSTSSSLSRSILVTPTFITPYPSCKPQSDRAQRNTIRRRNLVVSTCGTRRSFSAIYASLSRNIIAIQGSGQRLIGGRVAVITSVLLGCSLLASSIYFCGGTFDSGQGIRLAEDHTTPVLGLRNWSTMAPKALPGRPGTLTQDQEEKLREFWIATLQVFGVLGGQDNIPAPARADTTTSDKSKKKRLNPFSRKNKDSDAESAASPDTVQTGETEDKYGQTKQFQEALASQSPADLRATFWNMVKHDHPDALLLRFLRARKWDVEKALIMMVSTMKWRATEMHVDDDIMLNGEESMLQASRSSDSAKKSLGADFLGQMRMGISYLHGLDKMDRPMCFVRVRLHKQGDQSEASLERYTVFVIETARMILSPPVDTACIVFDMTGFTLANMDYSPVKFMIKCFEANYPESLGIVLVHKAPWIFQGIWKIIKGWLDPVVASKIRFTNNVEEMEEFVPRDHIPKELGGGEDWSYKYVEPEEGENEKMKDVETRNNMLSERAKVVKEFEDATISWVEPGDKNDTSAIKEQRNQLASILRDGYWKLDPYLRAKSVYDRVGMIRPGGDLQFYPTLLSNMASNTNGSQTAEASADDVE